MIMSNPSRIGINIIAGPFIVSRRSDSPLGWLRVSNDGWDKAETIPFPHFRMHREWTLQRRPFTVKQVFSIPHELLLFPNATRRTYICSIPIDIINTWDITRSLRFAEV